MLPKIHITSKKALSKSCLELNFIQKSPQVHMSIIHPWNGAWWLERWLKYYILLKGKRRFAFGLNTAENTHHI